MADKQTQAVRIGTSETQASSRRITVKRAARSRDDQWPIEVHAAGCILCLSEQGARALLAQLTEVVEL